MSAADDRSGDDRRQSAADVAMVDRPSLDPASPLTRYASGKNGHGVWQRLISMMPPHDVYIEPFLGSGAVLRRKRPASSNIGIDVDAGVIARHGDRLGFDFLNCDAIAWLASQAWFGVRQTMIYADPPYYGRSRSRSTREIYQHEMLEPERHAKLLQLLLTLPAMVMISGYRCRLYDHALKGWRRVDYQVMTRGGLKWESAWMNYPEPVTLHDYRFIGEDYHDRLRIQRKIGRWVGKLKRMPVIERAAVIAALNQA